jgi:DMSO/TMAO reductase YedYZ molybdopterin-dependent catalytic subunit
VRSLSLDDAQGAGTMLAYAMNGEALPIVHGLPIAQKVRVDVR